MSDQNRHGHDHEDADTGISASDDIKAHGELIKSTMKRADEIIAMASRGVNKEHSLLLKKELPELIGKLRHLLIIQLDRSGSIQQLDLSDGSYDNVYIDHALRKQITAIRNLQTQLHTMLGTKTVRKLTGFITEDIKNWFTVSWRQLKDNVKQYSKAGALVTGVGGALGLAGYSLATGDIGSGASLMGKHIGIAAGKSWEAVGVAAPYVSQAAKTVSHSVSWTFGKLSALFHPGTPLAPAHP